MSVICRTDVTAVKLYKEYILAGIGSWINIFDRKCMQLVQKIHVLSGQKIYHLVPSDKNEVLVIGGKQFSILIWEDNEFVVKFDAIVCNDWLHSGVWVGDGIVALLTAHNVVQKWDTVEKSMISRHVSKENSILYSGLLLPIQDDILVFSGTVFSQVLIHRCGSDGVLHTLKGHKGVIFSVSCNPQKGVIVTTSDDRALRIWQLKNNTTFLPNSIGYWENVNITCTHELYGHLARVMRNCIRDDFVISIGEDSCICFWGYNGSLLRKVTTHQNACIWSLDADDTHLVTGGGDSSVILHPVSMVTEYGKNEVVNIEVSNAKKVVFTARRNIIVLNEKDDLVYYDVRDKTSTTLKLKHDSTCKLLSMSSCKQLVAVVDMLGKLDVFIETCKGTPGIQNFIDTKLEIGKILFMQWTGNRHLVLCSENGMITVLASRDKSVDFYANFILPPCKERWLTAAAINLSKDMLVVGDRCGSLHVYVTGQKNPLKSFKKVHGRYGPTSINFDSDKIVTTGRCGTIKYFAVDSHCNVKLISSRTLEFQWIEKFVDKEKRYISGFQERIFVVYDMRNNSKLLEVSCGGGHRSWDVIRYIEKVDDSYEEFIKFVYLKNSNINIETFELNKIVSRNVINGTHSKEINCLKTYISNLDDSIAFYISGGEDTSLRISSINSNNEFRDVVIFKQLSSVRTLKTIFIDNNKLLVVSAGGRAQICIKLLQFYKSDYDVQIVPEELSDYLIKGTDKERKGNQTWRNCSVDFDPETRIMDVDIIKSDDSNFIVVAGCSDGYLRVFNFKYDGKNAVLSPLQELKHNDTCILKTHSFEYQDRMILLTCTTRGIVTFWEIPVANNLEGLQFKPFFSLQVHQSGINSVACRVINHEILLATGGDDNSLHLNLIELKDELKLLVTHNWMSNTLHCSQITGVAFIDDLIMTTSIDQRVTMLRLEVNDGIKCEFVSQVFSDVADIQGMDVLKSDSATITVCVFGKGFEVISMPRPSQ